MEEERVKALCFLAPVDPWNPGVQPVMDSADLVSSPSPPAPVTFEAILQCHEQMLVCLSEDVAALTQAATQCTPLSEPSSPSKRTLVPSSSAVSVASPVLVLVVCDFRLPTPEFFSVDVGKCAGFLTQCSVGVGFDY